MYIEFRTNNVQRSIFTVFVKTECYVSMRNVKCKTQTRLNNLQLSARFHMIHVYTFHVVCVCSKQFVIRNVHLARGILNNSENVQSLTDTLSQNI